MKLMVSLKKAKIELQPCKIIQIICILSPIWWNTRLFYESRSIYTIPTTKKDEQVVACLVCCRIANLRNLDVNDDILNLLQQNNNYLPMSAKIITQLWKKFVCLKKSYKLVIQYMNNKTWQGCCQLCIESLANNGIEYL